CSLVPIWTSDPIIHVTGPGQLAVRCSGKLIGAIERGVLVNARMDVFEAQWLKDMFATERAQIQAEHDAHQAHAASPTAVEPSLVGRVGQQMVKRAIQLIRNARQGGMLLLVNDRVSALRLKYRFQQDEPSHRYRTLLLRLLETVASKTSKSSVGWADFASDGSAELE